VSAELFYWGHNGHINALRGRAMGPALGLDLDRVNLRDPAQAPYIDVRVAFGAPVDASLHLSKWPKLFQASPEPWRSDECIGLQILLGCRLSPLQIS